MKIEPRELPRGRLGRVRRLAGLGARTAASVALGRDPEALAEHAIETLGTMRGLATKVGQMASYMDGVLVDGPARDVLARLQTSAASSDPALIRKVVEEDLGQPLDALFSWWEEEPFAAASIGEVHRAALPDGRLVAVKVQHPGLAEAMRGDLDNAAMMERIAGAVVGRMTTKAILDEVKLRFAEELDQRLEAERQNAMRAFFAGDPTIRVPEAIVGHSGPRVLTTEMAHGMDLTTALRQPADVREGYARTLWRFFAAPWLVAGQLPADPHPGNFFFGEPDARSGAEGPGRSPDVGLGGELARGRSRSRLASDPMSGDRSRDPAKVEGTVTAIDFGCVQPFDDDARRTMLALRRAAVDRDLAGEDRILRDLLGNSAIAEEFVAWWRAAYLPLSSSPFHADASWTAFLADAVGRSKRAMLSRGRGGTHLPAWFLLGSRVTFGLASILVKLDVTVDYAAVEREVHARAG